MHYHGKNTLKFTMTRGGFHAEGDVGELQAVGRVIVHDVDVTSDIEAITVQRNGNDVELYVKFRMTNGYPG